MWIKDLFGKHQGETIYIVGTGPSMRLFPVEFLKDKITIGLNQAWKYLWTSYGFTIHPELIREHYNTNGISHGYWITKALKPPLKIHPDHKGYYVFEFVEPSEEKGASLEVLRKPSNKLYHGRGIQCCAMNMALNMGASSIVLVGCDMQELESDHHGHEQHVKWNGLEPQQVYLEYRLFTRDVRDYIWEQHQVPVMSLTPFVGLNAREDYRHLKKVKKLASIESKSVQGRYREQIDCPEECR